ncbi:hypothetical protein J2Z31_000522 [Sinorhizobium kostiense]|uniref:Uncharacterized protein n=1 Tax=Sinorhizobium kostiense TaxID=76747 RepID=A0ABS4QWS3_9HYPH|nr:hypothetical protein [Sinorhizobium kostiense]
MESLAKRCGETRRVQARRCVGPSNVGNFIATRIRHAPIQFVFLNYSALIVTYWQIRRLGDNAEAISAIISVTRTVPIEPFQAAFSASEGVGPQVRTCTSQCRC